MQVDGLLDEYAKEGSILWPKEGPLVVHQREVTLPVGEELELLVAGSSLDGEMRTCVTSAGTVPSKTAAQATCCSTSIDCLTIMHLLQLNLTVI
jgi:hypothetical protein